jgi:hypothetical protein
MPKINIKTEKTSTYKRKPNTFTLLHTQLIRDSTGNWLTLHRFRGSIVVSQK